MVHILHHAKAGLIPLFWRKNLSIQANAARRLFQQPTETAHERCFSCAVMPDNAQNFSPPCRKTQIAEYWLLLKGTGKIFYRQSFLRAWRIGFWQVQNRRHQTPKPHLDALFFRNLAKFRARKYLHDLSILDKNRAIDQIHQEIQPVLSDHHRPPFLFKLKDLPAQRLYRVSIQVGRRLIQHKNRRIHGIDAGKGKTLFFAARHGKNVSSQKRLDLQSRNRGIVPFFDLLGFDPRIFQTKSDLAVRVDIKKLRLRILKYRANLLRQAIHLCFWYLQPINKHLAR